MSMPSPEDRGSFRRVLANSPIYALGEILQRGAGILLLPLYTRFLTTEEYGAAILVTLTAGFAAGLFSLHLQAAVVRFTYDAPDDQQYLERLYGSIFVFTTLLSMVLLGLSALVIPPALGLMGAADFWLPYAYLAAVIAATTSSYEILQHLMQAHYQAKRFVAQQWMFFSLGAGVTVILMVGLGVGGLSIVIGSAVANVAFHLYSLIYVARNYRLTLDRRLVRECLAYSVPLLPNRFAGLTPRVADRLFLSAVSVGAAGIYSAGYRLGEGLSYISGGFFRAQLPWFYETMGHGETGRLRIARVARRTILVISGLGLLLALVAEEGIRLAFGSAYQEAWKVVPFATFAIVFNSVKEFWLRSLTYEKSSTRYVPIATYTFAGLSIAFTAWWVPAFGIIGAAAAILGARFLSSLVMLFFSLRYQNVGYRVWEMYGLSVGAFLLSLVVYLPVTGLPYIKLVLGIAAIGFVAAVSRKELQLALDLFWRRSPVAAR